MADDVSNADGPGAAEVRASTTSPERYELGEVLGSGGQGNTYRAVDRETLEAVAVKVLTLRGSSWKGFDLFERECSVLATLDHPGIPRYIDRFADEEAGRFGLVMALVDGTPLSDAVRNKVYPSEARLWGLLEQALEILDYLHNLRPPVIHRDIKPANLLERPDGSLALVDFGGVRATLRPEGGSTVVGTFGYMAPEQLHGEALPATDVYALGATLTALALAREPDTLPRCGLKIDMAQLMTEGPLRDVLDRMLEPDPANRLADVAAVRAAISHGRAAGGMLASPAIRPHPNSPNSAALSQPPADLPSDPISSPPAGPGAVIGGVLGAIAALGFGLLDMVAIPLIFALVSILVPRAKQARLRERQQRVREQLRGGRDAFRRRLAGRSPSRGRGTPPPAPRQLPPGGRRGGRGHGRGGRRGRRGGRRPR